MKGFSTSVYKINGIHFIRSWGKLYEVDSYLIATSIDDNGALSSINYPIDVVTGTVLYEDVYTKVKKEKFLNLVATSDGFKEDYAESFFSIPVSKTPRSKTMFEWLKKLEKRIDKTVIEKYLPYGARAAELDVEFNWDCDFMKISDVHGYEILDTAMDEDNFSFIADMVTEYLAPIYAYYGAMPEEIDFRWHDAISEDYFQDLYQKIFDNLKEKINILKGR